MFPNTPGRRPERREPRGRLSLTDATHGPGNRARMKRFAKLVLVVLATTGAVAGAHNRAPHWDKVREALSKGLPKSALSPMDSIIAGAQRDHAWAEAVRAITLRIALEAAIQGNKPEEKILRMQAAIEKAPPQMRPVMEAILADWYWQYFQQNRWRFMQ